jgi:putative acetyltransferase
MTEKPVITIKIESAHSEAAQQLVADLTADLYARYGYGGECGFHPDDTAQPGGAFVVARLNGGAVGCGALRPREAGVGEIKRMYVAPETRRRGLSRQILTKLEDFARAFSYGTLRLETGDRQPEAMALYESAGYYAIASYDPEAHDEHSRCYEKPLR